MKSSKPQFEIEEVVDLHTNSSSLYHSVGHIIRTKIQSGEYQVGEKIPSERVLSESLNVGRATVRQGIDNLVKEGILRKEQGRGTFVAPAKVKQGVLRLLEFSDVIRENGLKPGFEYLGRKVIDPTPDIATRLNLSPDGKLIWIQRLMQVNNSPMLIETSYISSTACPDLLQIDDCTRGLRELLLSVCNIQIVRAHESFEPVILENDEAIQLGVEGGTPALWVEHLAFDLQDAPVAYITALIRGDRCRFYTDITFGS
jgi:GntR family transcriptional regulator